MALSIDQFLDQLPSSGLLSVEDVSSFLTSLPDDQQPRDGEALARALVKQKKLTKFQAEKIYAGKGSSLTLGNYVILDKLGQGGMGMVLKAEHKRMKRLVALKVMSPAAVKTPDALKRFHREVEAAAKLRHPNIVAADDADEAKGTHFLVMEYVDGSDLSALVKKRGPLPVEQAIRCIIQAARGLAFAHEQGVIHRDIKPANLLIDAKGTVKILDMGLARIDSAVGGSSEGAGLTNTGTIMGTVDYMSPEQAMDTKHADARSDIYSLGCSLYYLLTGHVVYDGDTMMKKLMAHQHAPIPSLEGLRVDGLGLRAGQAASGSTLNPQLSTLNQIFRRMVAKRPEDRPQSMTQVIAELERCLSGGSPTITLPSSSAPGGGDALQQFLAEMSGGGSDSATNPSLIAKTTVTRPKAVVATGSESAATIIASTSEAGTDPHSEQTLTVEQSERLRLGSTHTPASSRRRKTMMLGGSVAAAVVVLLAIVFAVRGKSGTLHLEITDSLVEVTIGDTGRVVKGTAEQDIPLSLGEHVLHVKRGDFAFDTDPFEITQTKPTSIKVEQVGRRVRAMMGDTLLGHKELSKPKAESVASVGRPPSVAKAPFDANQARAHQEAWAKHLGVPVEYTNSIGMKFVLIPPGEFTMGSTPSEIEEALWHMGDNKVWQEVTKSSGLMHTVILTKPIYLGVHEVTQAEYQQVMGQNPSYVPPPEAGKEAVADRTRFPVDMVTWNAAAEFCAKLSQQEQLKPFYLRAGEMITPLEGDGYRLPTEAEWEFSCRAGTVTRYCTGDKKADLLATGWFRENSGPRMHMVGELQANPFGLYDMHGNGMEWIQDWWATTYDKKFQEQPALDPQGASAASHRRVIRSGHWSMPDSNCRSSWRDAVDPKDHTAGVGIRVSLMVDAVRQALKVPGPPTPAIAPFNAKQARAHQEAWAKHLGITIETTNSVGAKMILIPPGEFLMGSTPEQIVAAKKMAQDEKMYSEDYYWTRHLEEAPQHPVTITRPFLMGGTEVTVAQFRKFVESSKYVTEAEQYGAGNTSQKTLNEKVKEDAKGLHWNSPGYPISDDTPVTQVSWNDACAFCAWLSEQEKRTPWYQSEDQGGWKIAAQADGYRLPTEAEWEYACRAGTTTLFSFGDDPSQLGQYAWYGKNFSDKPQPVALKLPNSFGLYDLHGNAWEWCQDLFSRDTYAKSSPRDPIGSSITGNDRVNRGGYWTYHAAYCRSAYRGSSAPSQRSKQEGFRIVRTLDAATRPE